MQHVDTHCWTQKFNVVYTAVQPSVILNISMVHWTSSLQTCLQWTPVCYIELHCCSVHFSTPCNELWQSTVNFCVLLTRIYSIQLYLSSRFTVQAHTCWPSSGKVYATKEFFCLSVPISMLVCSPWIIHRSEATCWATVSILNLCTVHDGHTNMDVCRTMLTCFHKIRIPLCYRLSLKMANDSWNM